MAHQPESQCKHVMGRCLMQHPLPRIAGRHPYAPSRSASLNLISLNQPPCPTRSQPIVSAGVVGQGDDGSRHPGKPDMHPPPGNSITGIPAAMGPPGGADAAGSRMAYLGRSTGGSLWLRSAFTAYQKAFL